MALPTTTTPPAGASPAPVSAAAAAASAAASAAGAETGSKKRKLSDATAVSPTNAPVGTPSVRRIFNLLQSEASRLRKELASEMQKHGRVPVTPNNKVRQLLFIMLQIFGQALSVEFASHMPFVETIEPSPPSPSTGKQEVGDEMDSAAPQPTIANHFYTDEAPTLTPA